MEEPLFHSMALQQYILLCSQVATFSVSLLGLLMEPVHLEPILLDAPRNFRSVGPLTI